MSFALEASSVSDVVVFFYCSVSSQQCLVLFIDCSQCGYFSNIRSVILTESQPKYDPDGEMIANV